MESSHSSLLISVICLCFPLDIPEVWRGGRSVGWDELFSFSCKIFFNDLHPKKKLGVMQIRLRKKILEENIVLIRLILTISGGITSSSRLSCKILQPHGPCHKLAWNGERLKGKNREYMSIIEIVYRLPLICCPSVISPSSISRNKIIRLSYKWFNAPRCKLQSNNKVILWCK